jgi:hypothetical protein
MAQLMCNLDCKHNHPKAFKCVGRQGHLGGGLPDKSSLQNSMWQKRLSQSCTAAPATHLECRRLATWTPHAAATLSPGAQMAAGAMCPRKEAQSCKHGHLVLPAISTNIQAPKPNISTKQTSVPNIQPGSSLGCLLDLTTGHRQATQQEDSQSLFVCLPLSSVRTKRGSGFK